MIGHQYAVTEVAHIALHSKVQIMFYIDRVYGHSMLVLLHTNTRLLIKV